MDATPPIITTIITTYRRPQLLKRAVNSVLKQTYPHFQVCVYDNASGDETAEIMHDLMKQDPRVKYHCHSENIGMMGNYAYAFSKINTQYFSFLSDDDFLLPWFYTTTLKGFNECPDAAFSACGVLVVDEKDQILSDPLALWKKEGMYDAPDGLWEMIKAPSRYPVPTGILFQHPLIRDISPNFDVGIQIVWDPDYLSQIVARFPIVIAKKTCAIYLTHQGTFCTGYYNHMFSNKEAVLAYAKATDLLLQRLLEIPHFCITYGETAKAMYAKMMRESLCGYINCYGSSRNFQGSLYAIKAFYPYYGINLKIILLLAKNWVWNYLPFMKGPIKSFVKILTSLKKERKPEKSSPSYHCFQEYAKNLCRDL